MREVAGPHGRCRVAYAQVGRDHDLGRLKTSQSLILVKGNSQTIAADRHAHHVDGNIFLIKLHAALAKRHGNAAPVAVVASDAGLDERRVGDSTGGDIGFLVVSGAGNVNRHEL